MPVYDFKCPQGCGYFDDIFVLLADHGTTTCPECGVLMDTVIGTVPIIGPMPSNPLVMTKQSRGPSVRATETLKIKSASVKKKK